MADQMRTEVEVLSQVHHVNVVPLLGWSKDGMAPCLVYAFMEGGSLQDRLACRGSGALVPLTANERMLMLSDVARGLAYLHSEVRVIHRDVKSANVLLDEGCRGRIGDFGIAKSLNDNHAGITVTHMQTEHVLGTQVYMAPEYLKGKLSTKVDSFAFGLVIIETLTGLPVLNPAVCHCNLLEMFEEDLDNPTKLLAHLDKRACWDQHKQERIGRLHSIAERCLEARRTRRPELVELIPELEEVRRGTEALPADVHPRAPNYMDSFHCPLTMEVMRDPVITADGQTYERAEIEGWFALGKRTSPLTGAELPSTHVTPNIALRAAIQESGLLN
jgi:interleukin-1 receptor-associated kinase 4